MDKNTIVEYIEESPQNTNRAILNQMLGELVDNVKCAVTSVNGQTGDVKIDQSWSSTKDKPFTNKLIEEWSLLADRVKEDNLPITSLLPMCSDLIRLKIVAEDGTEQIVSEGDKGVTVVRTGNRVNISVNSFGPVLEYLRILTDSSGNSNNSEDIKVKDLTLVNDHTSVSIYLLTERLISVINEESIPDSVVKITETHIAGWDEIVTNIHNDDENIVLSSPVDIDNLNLRIVTSAGEEDLITNDSKGLTINKKSDGSYVLVFISGVNTGTSVYEFRLKGNIDGSGDTIIPYVDMVTPSATLSVYQWNKSHEIIRSIDDTIIPVSIARKEDIKYPVTSVNGQTGDIVLSEGVKSWNDLQDKPFGEGYKLICASTDYVSEEIFKAGKNYIVIWNGVEYIGKTIDSNGMETYHEGKSSALFLYDKNGNYVTGTLACYYDDEYDAIVCTPYFIDDYNDTVYVYDPTETGIKTIDDKFISENIARKADIDWENLQDKPFEDASVVILPATPLMWEEGTSECIDFSPIVGGEYTLVVDGVEYKTTCLEHEFIEYMFPLYPDNPGGNAVFYESSSGHFFNYLSDFGYDKRINISLRRDSIKEIEEKFIPDTIARAPKATLENVTEAPTAEQYNALLAILRQAGILAT